ncbi:short-chain collagen C4-like [Pomacea canaliculata]|uniref:short-chain collagen C4-like n=1 Tax=Pomacea canaliculata TaxID=400727 RepID=UPI000D73A606|nr:short-chain collagen C4-like [Pomacea canaliculata]
MDKMVLLTFVCFLTSLPVLYTRSLETNVAADDAASRSGGLEMRKLRHIEAELEVLRRTVTEMKAGGQCGAQSPHQNFLREVTSEIQALRSQFQGLQVQRELSVLRSDLLAQSAMLADTGSKPVGRTPQISNERPRVADISTIMNTGAVYERWGNSGCPNGTELVYSGLIGGSHFTHTGAAANALCLPLNPVLENNPGVNHVAYIYGAELELTPLPKNDLDPLCAVCRSPRATIVMVPAASACLAGWTVEYSGYLMAGHHTHTAATEYICVDREQHTRTGSDKNDNGKYFYYVTAECGSLPCPPYVSGKVLPCVVCSK